MLNRRTLLLFFKVRGKGKEWGNNCIKIWHLTVTNHLEGIQDMILLWNLEISLYAKVCSPNVCTGPLNTSGSYCTQLFLWCVYCVLRFSGCIRFSAGIRSPRFLLPLLICALLMTKTKVMMVMTMALAFLQICFNKAEEAHLWYANGIVFL